MLNVKGTVTAIEVKSGNNKQSKSLNAIMSGRYNVKRGIKFEKTDIMVDEDGIEPLSTLCDSIPFRIAYRGIMNTNIGADE